LELAIERHAADRKLKLSPAAHRALLERSARNLSMIDEELDKLVLALKPAESGQKTSSANLVRPVSEQDIAEFCSTTRTYDAFNLADAILDKNTKSALEILDTIFSRGISDASKPGKVVTSESSIAMLLLGAITWKVTQLQDQLIAFQTGKESGKNDFAIFGELKLFGARQESLKRALKKHNAASMRRCVEAIYRANLNLRRGGSKSQEVLEEMLWAMLKSV
jgi:DNA polymerase III delta subunit